jgi:hypothetical protein
MDVRAEIKRLFLFSISRFFSHSLRGAWPVAKDFKIWMGSKIANKWKLLMDLCFQIPVNRPSFEVANSLSIDIFFTYLVDS